MAGWVLGCHRSGTSLLCSILRTLSDAHREQPLGPDATRADAKSPVEVADLDNPTGFHESASLVEVNERLLSWAGCSWDRPFIARPAWEDPRSLRLIASLRSSLSSHTTNVGWIDKDPRLCLTRDAFRHLLLRDPAAIAVMRHPLAVAMSLHRRDGFSLRKGAAIWLLYNLHLFNSHSPPPDTVVLFDDLISADEQVRLRVARELAAFSAAASGETIDRSLDSLQDRALSEMGSRQRNDLIRSENYWRGDQQGSLIDTLEDIWLGSREIIRGDRHDQMASYLRNAWAAVSPILEPEVAIPLHESHEFDVKRGRYVGALRRRAGRLTERYRLPGNGSAANESKSPTPPR